MLCLKTSCKILQYQYTIFFGKSKWISKVFFVFFENLFLFSGIYDKMLEIGKARRKGGYAMTYFEICRRLSASGIDNAEGEAARLLETFCGVSPEALLAAPAEQDYSSDALEKALSKREAHYPLQYLLGEWEFYRQTYEVSPDCLIPRSDTEILVDFAVKSIPQGERFADLCTGSGCIGISIAKNVENARLVMADKSASALKI